MKRIKKFLKGDGGFAVAVLTGLSILLIAGISTEGIKIAFTPLAWLGGPITITMFTAILFA